MVALLSVMLSAQKPGRVNEAADAAVSPAAVPGFCHSPAVRRLPDERKVTALSILRRFVRLSPPPNLPSGRTEGAAMAEMAAVR